MAQPTILIVSANQAQTKFIADSLAAAGYQTRLADPKGIATPDLNLDPPSLVILDWGVLSLTGLEWIRKMKSNDQLSQVPILVIGPDMAEEEFLAALEADADICLRERLHPRVLVARVHSLLRRNKSIQA